MAGRRLSVALGIEVAALFFVAAVGCGAALSTRRRGRGNRKLRLYPRFAAGLTCVRDCDAARAFTGAYKKYNQDRPGFDANEPMPRLLPPP